MRTIKHLRSFSLVLSILLFILTLASCSKTIGWGVLLWYTDNPGVPSGTIVPVYVRSNIENAWIAGLPEEYSAQKTEGDEAAAEKEEKTTEQKFEVPLTHLEVFKSRRKAEKRVKQFGEYARTYAETMQDGLPIRDEPANSGRRTYRLKQGEIVKILEKVEGVAAVGTTGAPLEGDWYRVLTETGSTGYCFSLRLRMFEHDFGPMEGQAVQVDTGSDPSLEIVLTRTWYPEIYKTIINSGRLDLPTLSKNYQFTPGLSNGTARINVENLNMEFPYKKIVKTGDRSWSFSGSSLQVSLRSDTTLVTSFKDQDGEDQSITFVTLPVSIENIVNQEQERRQNKFQALYVRGPVFKSSNYGTLTFASDGKFTWDGMDALPENLLSGAPLGSGSVDMDYYLSGDMAERYTGAMGMRFNAVAGGAKTLVFAYTLDNQGLRLEYIPSDTISRRTISKKVPEPFVIFFSSEG